MHFKVREHTQLVSSVVDRVKEHSKKGVLLLLPGGSFLDIAGEMFSQISDSFEDLSFLTITTVDERYFENLSDAAAKEGSNLKQLIAVKGAKKLEKKGARFVAAQNKGETLREASKNFDSFLTRAIHSEDLYKLAIIGVGSDYHTLGIMPHKQEYCAYFKKNYATGYNLEDFTKSENPFKERITMNFNGLMKMDDVFLYAVGSSKKTVLRNLVAANSPTNREISQRPVLFLHELKKDVYIFTDQNIYDERP